MNNSRRIFQTFKLVWQIPDYVKRWSAIVREAVPCARASWHHIAHPALPAPARAAGLVQLHRLLPCTSTAAATAFHFTPHCFVINHLPQVSVFQPILPRCLVAWSKTHLCVYRVVLPWLCPEVKDPFHGLTNPWLFCQLIHARGLKLLSLCTHPLGKQYKSLNSFHIQHPAGKTPEAGRMVAGIPGTRLPAGSMSPGNVLALGPGAFT